MSKKLMNRAISAYFKKPTDGQHQQPSATPAETADGKRYIVLHNAGGVLAVYRVRIVNGQEMLKGLKRWPAELNGV